MQKETYDLSIVIPCYNEMEHIHKSVKELAAFMDSTKLNYEMIFIDDCSVDGTLPELIKIKENHGNMRVYRHSANLGRGGTVSEGIMKAKGEVVGFIDIDLEVSPAYILPCYLHIKDGYDLAMANRIYRFKFKDIIRWLLSRGYNYLARKMLDIPFTDTEAGFKFFSKSKILLILKEAKNTRWFWDTEVVVWSYLKGHKIKEVPALYVRNRQKTSTVHVFMDTKDYFINLVRFRSHLKKIMKDQTA